MSGCGVLLFIGSRNPTPSAATPTAATAPQQAATSEPSPAPAAARPDLELLESKGAKGDYDMLTITGKIRNNTGKQYNYAQATFTVYNKAGEQVGSALANVNNLEPGGTWAFRAVGSAPGGDTFKLAGITGF